MVGRDPSNNIRLSEHLVDVAVGNERTMHALREGLHCLLNRVLMIEDPDVVAFALSFQSVNQTRFRIVELLIKNGSGRIGAVLVFTPKNRHINTNK